MKSILGIHHITAIAGDPQQNIDFYTGVLGLRLVKITVNFDDPEAYHFYYGDGHGRPGTILTFFSWPGARRGRQGNGQVTRRSLCRARKIRCSFWSRPSGRRAASLPKYCRSASDIPCSPLPIPTACVSNSWRLRSIDTAHAWEGSGVPSEFAIHGFHGATLSRNRHMNKPRRC